MAQRPDPQTDPHGSDDTVGPNGSADDQGDGHGHDDLGQDDHGQAGLALGPFDVPRWGAAAFGVALGLLVVLALKLSLS